MILFLTSKLSKSRLMTNINLWYLYDVLPCLYEHIKFILINRNEKLNLKEAAGKLISKEVAGFKKEEDKIIFNSS